MTKESFSKYGERSASAAKLAEKGRKEGRPRKAKAEFQGIQDQEAKFLNSSGEKRRTCS